MKGQKPGPADSVEVNGELELDSDLSLKKLMLGPTHSVLIATGKKIKVGVFDINIVDSGIKLKNSSMEVARSLDISKGVGTDTIIGTDIILENSSFKASNLMAAISQANLNLQSNSGITIDMKGNSLFELKSEIILDDVFKGPPSTVFLKFKITERESLLPYVKVGDPVNLKGVVIEVRLLGNMKKGKYPIFLCGSSSKTHDFSKAIIKLNGKTYNLKEEIEVGDFKASMEVANLPKFGNGLILTLK